MKDLQQQVQLHGLGCMVAVLSQDVISVSHGGGNRWWIQLDKWSILLKKVTAEFVAAIWKRWELSVLKQHPLSHRCCHRLDNANRSLLDRPSHFCLTFRQTAVSNNSTILKDWSDDGGVPNSKSVSRKTSMLRPFKVVQVIFSSGENIVNVQIPCQIVINVDSKEFRPTNSFNWVVINSQDTELWKTKKHFFGLRVHDLFSWNFRQSRKAGCW